jgi:aspartate aminotransferase/aminotransferase
LAKPSKRAASVDASGVRRVFDLAARLKNPCDLSIGQPDFDVPEPLKEAAIRAIRDGFNRYTVTQGIPELREAVRLLMRRTRNWEPEDVFITAGVSGGLCLAALALIDEGDEVIIPDPYFVAYKQLVRLVGGRPVFADTYPDFRLTPAAVERAVTRRSKLLFLNTPANPTGAVAGEEDLKGIAEICRRHDITVISDEVYSDFCYDAPFAGITKHLPEALVMGGFSKTYAFTGWRLGYVCGPKAILQEMVKLQQFSFVCAPSMVQKAGVAALDFDASAYIAEFRRKRDAIYDGLKDKFEVARPAGAFYIFPKVPRGTDREFVERAIERECLVIPGSVFSERNTHFRISYATGMEQIRRGVEILNSLA